MKRGFIRFDSLFSARNRCVEVAGSSLGTGVIVETGLVFTNLHLIEDKEDTEIEVEGIKVEQVLYHDLWFDFASLVVKTREVKPVSIEPKAWSNQPVFYIGNPGEKIKSIQLGRVERVISGRIDITVECEEGFSGSGLYNLNGQLIGLTDSFDPADDKGLCKGCAIPGWALAEFLDNIKGRNGAYQRFLRWL